MQSVSRVLLGLKAVDLDTEAGFLYTSGRRGPIYCDNRLVLSYPKERGQIVDSFIALIEEKGLDADIIAGVATGAIAWGVLIAERLKKPFVYVRASSKDHGKGNQIEGEIEEGKKVLVIEDLVNSGKSSVAACDALRQASCDVVACVAIVNYAHANAGKIFTEAKIPLYSLTNFSNLLTTASEMEYINADHKKSLLEWHKDPAGWKSE